MPDETTTDELIRYSHILGLSCMAYLILSGASRSLQTSGSLGLALFRSTVVFIFRDIESTCRSLQRVHAITT